MRVKFCGITNLDDGREAARLGAWAIGLNHHPESPRFCEPEVAAEIGASLKRRLEIVGVFVNPSLDELAAAAENEALTMVQLHGDEGPAFCREAARRTGCKVIKALRVRSGADIRAAEAYRTDFHLLDAHRPGTPGGTGESFDWELLAGRRVRGAADPGRWPDPRERRRRGGRPPGRSPSTWRPGWRPSPASRTTR